MPLVIVKFYCRRRLSYWNQFSHFKFRFQDLLLLFQVLFKPGLIWQHSQGFAFLKLLIRSLMLGVLLPGLFPGLLRLGTSFQIFPLPLLARAGHQMTTQL